MFSSAGYQRCPKKSGCCGRETDVLWAPLRDMFVRSEYYIDRLLKGATVADLPIEQASELKSVANLKTANRYCTRRNCPREGRWHRRTTALDDVAIQLLLADRCLSDAHEYRCVVWRA